MHQLIDKLNLVDLTVAYGMSASGPLMYFAADSDGHIVAETRWDRFLATLEGPLTWFRSPVSFQSTPEDPIIKRVETVGKVQPHVRAKIIDREGEIVPVGTPGELCVAGYLLQKGYVPAFLF